VYPLNIDGFVQMIMTALIVILTDPSLIEGLKMISSYAVNAYKFIKAGRSAATRYMRIIALSCTKGLARKLVTPGDVTVHVKARKDLWKNQYYLDVFRQHIRRSSAWKACSRLIRETFFQYSKPNKLNRLFFMIGGSLLLLTPCW
jgi:hypothetical protein